MNRSSASNRELLRQIEADERDNKRMWRELDKSFNNFIAPLQRIAEGTQC
jgi:hypothetical protein